MGTPIDTENLPPSGEAARLPALGTPELTPEFLAKVKEILEIMLGRRGQSKWDRVVTFRDLYGGGINLQDIGGWGRGGADYRDPSVVDLGLSDVQFRQLATRLETSIRQSPAFRALTARIGSAEELADFPDEIRVQLQQSLADLARELGAEIRTVDHKVQNSAISMASRMQEITAALDNTAAGVRHFDAAYSNRTHAMATSITQVTARMDNADGPGSGVTVEEKFLAQADINSGLQGQWSVKIQAGTDANPVIAGVALAVDAPEAGPGTSSFIILVDQFGFFANGGTVMPFGADASGAYVNGTLRVNAGGLALQDVTASAKRITLVASSQVFQITQAGGNNPASITLTATAANLSGTPSFTIPSGTATLSAGTDAYQKVLTFGNMGSESVTIRVTQDGQTDEVTIIKVREGTNAVTGLLTNEAHTLQAATDGTVSSFTGAASTMKVYIGATDDSANWTYTKTDAAGITSTIASNVVTITAMSADTSYVDITAAKAGYTSITKRFSVSKSKTGAGGAAGANAKLLALLADAQVFQVKKDGTNSPASITFTTNAQNLAGSPTFTVTSGTATLTGAGTSRTLTFANLTTDTATIQVAQDGLTDTITIAKVREGADAITGLLTNEAAVVAADSSGTVASFASAGGTFKLFDGITDKTGNAAVTYSVVSSSSVTISIDATGAYAVTAMSADTGTATLRAVYGSVTVDKIYTIAKSKTGATGAPGTPGTPGASGPRGSLTLYASGGAWSDTTANNAITSASGSSTRIIGDTVTISNSTFAATKYWSGSAWVDPGVVINGNLLVLGTASALLFDGVGLKIGTGHTPSGKAFEVTGSGTVWADNIIGAIVSGDNTSYASPSVKGTTYRSGYSGVVGLVASGYPGGHGVDGLNVPASAEGIVGYSGGYAFKAISGTAGPFTGSHDTVIAQSDACERGDIMVDAEKIAAYSLSDTLFRVVRSSAPCSKRAIGVANRRNPLDFSDVPPALIMSIDPDYEGDPYFPEFYALLGTHDNLIVNSVGEGQINVCGEGGNIKAGDLIVTSSMPGKGMRQADDLVRGHTVAKARESVTFDAPDQVKTIACIYLCG